MMAPAGAVAVAPEDDEPADDDEAPVGFAMDAPPRTRSDNDCPDGNVTPLGSAREKLPLGSVSPVAIT